MLNQVDTAPSVGFPLEFITKAPYNCSIKEWIEVNKWVSNIPDVKQELLKDPITGYKFFFEHQWLFDLDEFDWQSYAE